ncbi:MAG: AAA family ATPase, partial [Candidatus Woesearchaeota archaeon]
MKGNEQKGKTGDERRQGALRQAENTRGKRKTHDKKTRSKRREGTMARKKKTGGVKRKRPEEAYREGMDKETDKEAIGGPGGSETNETSEDTAQENTAQEKNKDNKDIREMTFASVLDNPIYKKRDILYSMEPPTGFLHRTEQKNELIMELAPILMGSAVSCVFVYGNPGTGKTGLILDLMKELESEADNKDIKLKTAYVNCSENRTETIILLSVLSQLNPEKEYPAMGWTRTKALAELNKLLDKDMQLLIILDEVDYVLKESGDDILYRLSRINNDTKANVSSLIISNDVRVADYLKPRTQSTFGRVKVIFSPYTADELYDILKERAKGAFKPGVAGEAVLKKIAEIEAQRNGDARKAMEMLDACAKAAIAKKRDKITLDLVEDADRNLERDQTLNVISTLTRHQKILYLVILKPFFQQCLGTVSDEGSRPTMDSNGSACRGVTKRLDQHALAGDLWLIRTSVWGAPV